MDNSLKCKKSPSCVS